MSAQGKVVSEIQVDLPWQVICIRPSEQSLSEDERQHYSILEEAELWCMILVLARKPRISSVPVDMFWSTAGEQNLLKTMLVLVHLYTAEEVWALLPKARGYFSVYPKFQPLQLKAQSLKILTYWYFQRWSREKSSWNWERRKSNNAIFVIVMKLSERVCECRQIP